MTFRPENFEALEAQVHRRNRLGILQCDVAAAMRLHPTTVNKYERGRVLRVSDAWVGRYSDALDRVHAGKEAARKRAEAELAKLTPESREALQRYVDLWSSGLHWHRESFGD